jgi:hypothetical protein
LEHKHGKNDRDQAKQSQGPARLALVCAFLCLCTVLLAARWCAALIGKPVGMRLLVAAIVAIDASNKFLAGNDKNGLRN